MVALTGTAVEIVIVMVLEFTGLLVAQEELDVTLQYMASPLTGMFDHEVLFVPTTVPFRCHS